MAERKKYISRLVIISKNSISQVLGVFSILILSLIIVRYHSVELWGEYAELLIWCNFILLFLNFGHYDLLLRSFSKTPSRINELWSENIVGRSLLLIPTCILVFFIPLFNGLELLIIFYILLQFLSQSFRVFVVFYRKFIFNIWVEVLFISLMAVLLFFAKGSLDLSYLLYILVVSHGIKLLVLAVYFLKDFKKFSLNFKFRSLQAAVPFFIPVAVGTVRVKIDAYYGSQMFTVSDLSKYQIFISFLALAQMISSFVISPFLKNLYRAKDTVLMTLQRSFFGFGWFFALLMGGFMYLAIEMVYGLSFTFSQYMLAILFMIPLFLHVLLISEYYKNSQQTNVALFSSIVVLFQIVAGYYLIYYWNIDGALMLKALGQWGIVVILWLWIRRKQLHEQ